MTRIHISNMKCMGCVANAKQALENLPGLESVDINLEQASGELQGDFDLAEAIKRLTDAGYPAEKQD
jgi:copper chaperone CopZ